MVASLQSMKAINPVLLDVEKVTEIAYYIIVAEGASKRHIVSIADKVWEDAKKAKYEVLGIEGRGEKEWILIDLNCVVVHIMLPAIRELYRLESLWQVNSPIKELGNSI